MPALPGGAPDAARGIPPGDRGTPAGRPAIPGGSSYRGGGGAADRRDAGAAAGPSPSPTSSRTMRRPRSSMPARSAAARPRPGPRPERFWGDRSAAAPVTGPRCRGTRVHRMSGRGEEEGERPAAAVCSEGGSRWSARRGTVRGHDLPAHRPGVPRDGLRRRVDGPGGSWSRPRRSGRGRLRRRPG